MKTPKAFTLVEGLVAGGLVLVLAVPMLLGVLDTRRRSRDAMRVSSVRQAQAALETYRAKAASFPANAVDLGADDVALLRALGYEAQPPGCAADRSDTCSDYRVSFVLEGSVGMLPGGICTASAQGLSCSR